MVFNFYADDGSYLGFNQGEDLLDAIRRFETNRRAPIYCKLHDEMPPEQRRGEIGKMGHYLPKVKPVASHKRMREVWMGGGYCLVPYAD